MKEEAHATNVQERIEMDSAIINASENNSVIPEQNVLIREEEF
jgi:hypothetical protein